MNKLNEDDLTKLAESYLYTHYSIDSSMDGYKAEVKEAKKIFKYALQHANLWDNSPALVKYSPEFIKAGIDF